ncbi:MAG: aryl-sulfate sulfotransferase [Chthoniobacteraceae bacterium]
MNCIPFFQRRRLVLLRVAVAVIAPFSAGCDRTPSSKGDAKPFAGYTLLLQLASHTTDLVDMEGRVVHRWTSRYGLANGARLLPNGDLVRSGVIEGVPNFAPGLSGVIERFDWDGNLLWTYTLAEPRKILHHDVEVLPNGNVLLTAVELKDKTQQLEGGRDPARMRGDTLWIDSLMEIKPTGRSGGEIVWEWNVWDHLVQDFDPKVKNHGIVSEHPERIDINFIETPVPITGSRLQLLQSVGYVGGAKTPLPPQSVMQDWTHINSISYNPQFDQILLTSRSLGEVWIIDHGTTTAQAAAHAGGKYGRGGDLLYRWGNPQAYQRGKPSDQKLFGPHDGQWIPSGSPGAGNVLVFNNGDGRRDGNFSTVEEFRPPVGADGSYKLGAGAFGPETAVWSYVSEPREKFFSSFLSGAERLPNGNTLICSGVQREVFEVTPSGRRVWSHQVGASIDAQPPQPAAGGGLNPTPPGNIGASKIPTPPLISILDINGDGILDADELAQAPARLLMLDLNHDGRLTVNECLPPPPGGLGGPGGPPGGPGGPPGGPPGGQGGPPGGMPGPPPLPPIFTVLDINGNGILEPEEIAQAAASLRKLDTKGTGRLTRDEYLPPPGGISAPPGGPGGGPGGPPPLPPILTIFNPDRDGTIPAVIANAPAVLWQLDRNNDGKLTADEYLPVRPGGGLGPPPGGTAGDPTLPPIITALDTNHDGIIDAAEIAAAGDALKKLDRNGDGKITVDESLGGPAGGPSSPSIAPGAVADGGLFRALRFSADDPALKGRKLVPLGKQ